MRTFVVRVEQFVQEIADIEVEAPDARAARRMVAKDLAAIQDGDDNYIDLNWEDGSETKDMGIIGVSPKL